MPSFSLSSRFSLLPSHWSPSFSPFLLNHLNLLDSNLNLDLSQWIQIDSCQSPYRREVVWMYRSSPWGIENYATEIDIDHHSQPRQRRISLAISLLSPPCSYSSYIYRYISLWLMWNNYGKVSVVVILVSESVMSGSVIGEKKRRGEKRGNVALTDSAVWWMGSTELLITRERERGHWLTISQSSTRVSQVVDTR